ncbi:hypothetical protein ACROYT_G027181 [Oculina patagonica]
MGTGASKATSRGKKDNKKLKPARSKIRTAKQSSVPEEKKLTVENLWAEPRHERGKWKELLEKNLLNFEPFPLEKKMVDEMLSGKTLNTKASDVRIIRVFISCTFTDTAQESNLLIADVYPYLKLFGRKYGFEFAPSEMRWGIREESSSDHMTSIICMAEIARCQKESQGINYVVFLCDKYGFRPFPARIEASEFEQLLDQAKKDNDPDVNLLSDWFDLNTNLVPPTYMLKPSTQAPKDKWWDIFRKLQMTLRKASRCLKDKERAKWYTVSVTEEEVHRGLLYMDNRDQKTFFYRRKIVDVENKYKDEIAGKFIDKRYSDGSIDTEAQNFLNKLKNETVPGVLHPSNIKDFTVSWGPGITLEQHADYLREFGDHFCSLMVNSMTEAIKGSHVADDVLFEEVKSHAVFCREKADQVIGKEGILEQVKVFSDRESASLVAGILMEAFYRTEVLTETVRKPATGFANVDHVTALAHDRIDYASRSAVEPSLNMNTPASRSYRCRPPREVACTAPGSVARKCSCWCLILIRVRRESATNQDVLKVGIPPIDAQGLGW